MLTIYYLYFNICMKRGTCMNIKKVNLQKAVGIINIILGIFQTILGVLFAFASALIVGIISAFGDGAGDTDAVSAVLGTIIVATGIIILAFGIVMIIMSAKLLGNPKPLPDGRIHERSGCVIFLLIVNILMAFTSLSSLFSEFDIFMLIILFVYIAAAVLAIVSLTMRHGNTPNNDYGPQDPAPYEQHFDNRY